MSREQLIDLTQGLPEGYKIPYVHIFDQTGRNESIFNLDTMQGNGDSFTRQCPGWIIMPILNVGGNPRYPCPGKFFFLRLKVKGCKNLMRVGFEPTPRRTRYTGQ